MLSKSKGSFQTPGYPHSPVDNTACVWMVSVPKTDDKKTTNIIEFSFEIKDGGSKDRCVEVSGYMYLEKESYDLITLHQALRLKFKFKIQLKPQ